MNGNMHSSDATLVTGTNSSICAVQGCVLFPAPMAQKSKPVFHVRTE